MAAGGARPGRLFCPFLAGQPDGIGSIDSDTPPGGQTAAQDDDLATTPEGAQGADPPSDSPSDSPSGPPSAPPTGFARGWPLTRVLFATFGALTVIATLGVLAVGLLTAARNTLDLLQDKADLTIRLLEARVSDHLSPGAAVVDAVVGNIERDDLPANDPKHFRHFLEGALAGLPQVAGVMYVDRQLRGYAAVRRNEDAITLPIDLSSDEQLKAVMAEEGALRVTAWGGPFWRPQIRSTILVVRRGVYRNGELAGAVLAMVRIRELSRYLKKTTEGTDIHAFILLNRWRVLAHPELVDGTPGTDWRPTPSLSELQDPVMRRLWDPAYTQPAVLAARPPLENHVVDVAGVNYVAFYKRIPGYGTGEWFLGAYVQAQSFGQQLVRLTNSAVVGGVAVVVALILAVLIGRRISRPVGELSQVANKVAAFELDGVKDLPGSRIRELDEQSRAFNAMLGAMRWFQAYVPKTLVRRLVREGSMAGIASDNRSLTVMFTDVAGFSTMAEGASAADVADFLNEHFDLVTRCIDAEGGTVDKFIGDSVMAFWGAPEKQKNRALHACRAALAIRDAVIEDNARRARRGLPALRMRIGIHSGRATVGNIGSADRLNYTAIGDVVNVAQRLEQLGKEVGAPGADVVILISGETRRDLENGFDMRAVGDRRLRGRAADVEVFELLGLHDSAPPAPA